MISTIGFRSCVFAAVLFVRIAHATTGDCGTALGLSPAEAAARKSLQTAPPEERLDGGSSLRDANFDTNPDHPRSVLAQGRYQISSEDYAAAMWVEKQGIRDNDAGRVDLVKLMLLKQIEWLGSIPNLACIHVKSDPILKEQLTQLVVRGRQLQADVYLDPINAELLKRIQASRSRLFALAASARSGDSTANAEIRRLAVLVARDPFTSRAVKIQEAYESLLTSAYQKAQTGSEEGAYAVAVLRVESYSDYEARDYITKVDVQKTLAVIGDAIVVAQVADAGLKAAADADERDNYCNHNTSFRTQGDVDKCRADWAAGRRRPESR